LGAAHITLVAPTGDPPATGEDLVAAGTASWLLAAARQFDDALLRLRFNEPEIGTWVLHAQGDAEAAAGAERVLTGDPGHWLVNELRLYWARTLKRLDLSARTLVALVEPGSCFTGLMAELVLAADRSFMLDGAFDDADQPPPTLRLGALNDGALPMSNGISRLATRFWGREPQLRAAREAIGEHLDAAAALRLGLVTFTPDDIDWLDEVRVALEERNSFSPDALTGLEANLRFAGPETMETKIFARLSAWQNWIFQRPNAVGPDGALKRFGTGSRPNYDRARV
jgi:benzoyl-CoA-dihydrodiol lyase